MSGEVYIYNGVDEVPEDVTHVRVDPSVTVIPDRAFRDRQELAVVELPEGLIRIGDYAFTRSKSLVTINLPSTLADIGICAFDSCFKLEMITLPDRLHQLGRYAFYQCNSLQRINIPSNLDLIGTGTGAFLNCNGLIDVVFSEGVREIVKHSFAICESLVSVTLPTSLKSIGVESFEGCDVLNEIHIPDTIESIQARAFKNCNFTNFRMPPLVTNVDINILDGNRSLISLELSENITQITITSGHSQPRLESLRNVALPSECEVNTDIFEQWDNMGKVFPDDNNDTITEALKHRFDDLPIHKICYYQSYHDNETTMQSLKREINPWTSKPPGQLNLTGKEQDCLGMTPLHILACSTKPTIEMYRLVIEKYPETLIMKDKWGDIPLLYAIWCSASVEVLDLLAESYKSLHPDYEFDWKGMLLTMAKRNVPMANVQRLVNTQQSSFPGQDYDMQLVVLELTISDVAQLKLWKPYTSIKTFRYLLQVSISKRLDSLGINRWRMDLENTNDLFTHAKNRDRDTLAVYDRLATYESIKEGTSVLEMALWKAKLDESRNKRARVDGEVNYRGRCRINSGADIVIRNVLPYLLPY